MNNKDYIKKTNNRIYYLDVLRFIACLAVIMIHSSSYFVMENIGSTNFWIGNIFDAISRIAVPIFVMISGALMLDKNYQYSKDKLVKHLKKMVFCFVFWSLMYVLFFNIIVSVFLNHQPFDLMKSIIAFMEGYYHLWFIYLIIGLYLIVPLLRLWVKDENKKYIQYFLALAIIFTFILPEVITIGSYFSSFFQEINLILEEKMSIKYVGGFTAYFVMGWYLKNYNLEKKKLVYILGIFSILITIFGTYFLSIQVGKTMTLLYKNLTINVFLQSVMLFSLIKEKFDKPQLYQYKFIMFVSKYSFGVYVMHAFFVTIMFNTILPKLAINNAFLGILLLFLPSFIFALVGSFVFSKISFLKKFV